MCACGKMPMRTFAGGRFTSVQFATCEDCPSLFPRETEMSVGLLGSTMLLLGQFVIKRRATGFKPWGPVIF